MSLRVAPSMMMNDVKYRPLTKQNNHIGSPVYSGPHDGLFGKCDTIINKSGTLGEIPIADSEISTRDRGGADGDGSAKPLLDTGEAPFVW